MNSLELRAAFSLAFIYVLRMLGLFMIMPVMAIAAHKYPDYSVFLVGLAIGGYGLTQACLQIPMGVLSDKIGRKPVIIIGLLLFSAGSLVAAYADSLVWVVVGRFLQGAGAIAGAIMALAGDLSRDNQRPKVMAIIGVAIGFSFYIALLMGPVIANGYGLRGIFLATGLLALLCILLVLFVVPNAHNIAPKGDTLPVISDLKTLLRHPQLLRLNLSVLFLHMLITLLFVHIPRFFVSLGWPLAEHWQLYLIVLLSSVMGLALIMTTGRKLSQSVLMFVCVLGLATVFAALAIDSCSMLLIMLLVSVFFTCFNYLEANFPAMVSSIAPAGKKGSAMGIYASFQFFGAFLGGVLSSAISQYWGSEWVFGLAALICLVWSYLIKGLHSTERLKRYTLKVDSQGADHLAQQLAEFDGVEDLTVIHSEQVIYIKVDSRKFDIQRARKSLNLEE
ncbi:MFS transporter [Paraglaciecola hydrolytica]|uniref:MFS transporter n=1 Tax=Paraglaciecola hydrolytica TaxID=1799789 RepID=A0A136A4P2_9ALTE|nr:MFS transporter [Paraglaciecola hydrolytica]KXI30090.1 MFS transporter [Paraglaciecola hydrolytica]